MRSWSKYWWKQNSNHESHIQIKDYFKIHTLITPYFYVAILPSPLILIFKVAFRFKKLEIPDVILIEPSICKDGRGSLIETFKRSNFIRAGIKKEFVQDLRSQSQKNTLRGLHYQLNPMAQGKLVQCTRGCIFDVSVDLRKHSPTYGKWIGIELSENNHLLLFIPEGFAHGFLVLSDLAEVSYKMTKEYASEYERRICWNDPDLNIRWPTRNPLLSKKDLDNPCLKEAQNNFI